MKRTVEITADGSPTISIAEMQVSYHSKHGALQESRHVFIEAGLKYMARKFTVERLSVFEMGFGTGLNALLTWQEATKLTRKIFYYGVEKFPLTEDEWRQLDYGKLLNAPEAFEMLHRSAWEKDIVLDESFTLHKTNIDLKEVKPSHQFHVIYFDAFAPTAQPELWTEAVFKQMFSLLHEGGALVTYCSKSDVRRAMQAAGFTVEKLQGPPGKREMVRGIR